jgi:DNA-binding beta-propeller fold protein YncE
MKDPSFRLAYDFGAKSFPGGAAITPNDKYYVAALAGRSEVALFDLTDPLHPRQTSKVRLDRDPDPDKGGRPRPGGTSGLAMASDGSRVAVADYTIDVPTLRRDGDHRVYMLRIDDEKGELRVDTAFRDENTDEVGLDFNRTKWPHGSSGPARPRGLLFVAEPPEHD